MKRARTLETIAGRVSAAGVPLAGDGYTVQKGGAGVYTIFLPQGFRLLSATASAEAGYAITTSFSEKIFQVFLGTVASPSVATNNNFSFIAVGYPQ